MKRTSELEKPMKTVIFSPMEIHKKVVVDDAGKPQEVIIPWAEFKELEEMLGLDFEPEVAEQLEEAKRDRESGEASAYISLSEL